MGWLSEEAFARLTPAERISCLARAILLLGASGPKRSRGEGEPGKPPSPTAQARPGRRR